MASLAVMTAVETRLANGWTYAPVITPNTISTPPADGGPFLAVTYPVANEEQKSIGAPGSNVFREHGAFRFVLSVPFGSGLAQWGPWIEELRTLFRNQQFDGVTTWEADPPAINEQSDDLTRTELSIAVVYKYDGFF